MEHTSLTVLPLELPGVVLITPTLYADERGFFAELYSKEIFAALGITDTFVQDSVSRSHKNVIRGLHYQRSPHAQAKLVRCASGEIFDVAADLDPESPTFGHHVSAYLSEDTQIMLYIPGRYAHGFAVLSDTAVVEYKLEAVHSETATGARYDDPALSISWPVSNPILSEKDRSWAPVGRPEPHAH